MSDTESLDFMEALVKESSTAEMGSLRSSSAKGFGYFHVVGGAILVSVGFLAGRAMAQATASGVHHPRAPCIAEARGHTCPFDAALTRMIGAGTRSSGML